MRQTSPRPFSKKSKLNIYLDKHSNFCTVYFYCISKLRTTLNILKFKCGPLALPQVKLFQKKQKKV